MELLRALSEILKIKPFRVPVENYSCILEEATVEGYPSTRIKIKNHSDALVYRFDFYRSEIDLFPYNEPYSQYKKGLKFKHLKCGEDCSLHVHCD
mgnify:CR=1 FL=1